MQTRRDQLQAYRFQNRRALAALVAGEPNLLDPPMRRLTVTTISGIMIAVLVTVGFTVFGFIRPKAGDSWKDDGSVIVEQDTGATFVYLDGTLHGVTNYTSAVLAVSKGQQAKTVEVERDDIDDAKRGDTIGIVGLPSTLPPADGLVSAPVDVCSRQRTGDGNDDDNGGNSDFVTARVEVHIARQTAAKPLADTRGIVVSAGSGSTQYLLFGGQRLEISAGRTATALGLTNAAVLQVGTAFLNAIPQGPKLSPPRLPGAGTSAGLTDVSAVVGQLLRVSDDRYFVAMADGVSPVNPVQRALLQSLPLGASGQLLDPVSISESDALNLPQSRTWPSIVAAQLDGLPQQVPQPDSSAATNGGVCARLGSGERLRFAIPASSLPSYRPSKITQSQLSARGFADAVTLPPGSAAVVKSADGGQTPFLVGDTGSRYAAAGTGDDDVLASFGYSAAKATPIPSQLLALIPTGHPLNRTDALRPVTR